MIYEMLNCSFVDGVDPIPNAQDGDEFWLCKMAQRDKQTPLFVGKKIFILGGDWSNVKPDPNFTRDEHAVFTEFEWSESTHENTPSLEENRILKGVV